MRLPNKSEYPSEVHVCEETYKVKFVDKIPQGGRKCVGLCDPGTRTIYIKNGLTKSQTFRTFTHEAIHALEAEWEIDMPHKMVYQFEKAIVDFLLMNF